MYTEEDLKRMRRQRKRRRARRRALRSFGFLLGTLGLTLALHQVCRAETLGASALQPTFSRPGQEAADVSAPVLTGVADRTVYLGQTIAYLEGVTALDDRDPFPTIQVDSGDVDLATPGTYEVRYTAADASGNAAQASAKISVEPWPLENITDEMIDAAADAVLREIVPPDMAVKDQVYKVYRWAWDNILYRGQSDRGDWRKAAYVTIATRAGDCYGYFAASKLLLERMGLSTIDVVKVKNSPEDSDHFWSLVSIDGGSTYYHFDCTPRWGQKQAFCLVTDAFLDDYSQRNHGSHNRDKSLYPATPEV